MELLGIKGIIPKQNLSKLGDPQYKHPYYLAGMSIYRSNQAWGIDISYVILPTGKMYVISLLDLFSRFVLSYIVTNTLDTIGCIECLNNAIASYGNPHVLNSDQGSQFTSHGWVSLLQSNQIVISMDGKGRWADNVYVERFWRTLKYECIFMLGIETVTYLHKQVAVYIEYYNKRRLHSALGYKTPESVYLANLTKTKNEEFIMYCDWPPKQEQVVNSKKTVRPTIVNEQCGPLMRAAQPVE
jgi:putative transposase